MLRVEVGLLKLKPYAVYLVENRLPDSRSLNPPRISAMLKALVLVYKVSLYACPIPHFARY
jgi:hypothetical protein